MLRPGTVGADPLADRRAQAAQIAARLSADDHRINQLSEQYDGARLHQQQIQGQLATARADLVTTAGRAQAMRAQLQAVALAAYLRSGQPLVMHLPDRADVALATVGRAYEELAAGNRRELLDGMRALTATLTSQKAQLEAASRAAEAATAQVGQLRHSAEAAVSEEQALLSQVKGELAILVAQAQAAREAQLAAQVQADLAARAAQQAASRGHAAPVLVSSPSPLLPGRPAPGPPAPGPPAPRPPAPGPPAPGPPAPAPAPRPSSRAGIAVATAEAQLGKPYQWGAAGPGSFDCSGLTMFAWAAAGVSLAHYTAAQYAATTHIALSDLQPGDLVFFYGDLSHVGIYVGGGTMIHSPHTGTVVSYASIYQMGTTAIFASRVS